MELFNGSFGAEYTTEREILNYGKVDLKETEPTWSACKADFGDERNQGWAYLAQRTAEGMKTWCEQIESFGFELPWRYFRCNMGNI
jgi:hypothetical protein